MKITLSHAKLCMGPGMLSIVDCGWSILAEEAELSCCRGCVMQVVGCCGQGMGTVVADAARDSEDCGRGSFHH